MSERTYFKATRTDGTDFRTGTVHYRVGERVTHPAARKVRDDPSTYLSVATVPTDCTGFRWPCRLCAVHGVGRPSTSSTAAPLSASTWTTATPIWPAHASACSSRSSTSRRQPRRERLVASGVQEEGDVSARQLAAERVTPVRTVAAAKPNTAEKEE